MGNELQSPLSTAVESKGLKSSFVKERRCHDTHLNIKALVYEHRHALMSYYSMETCFF